MEKTENLRKIKVGFFFPQGSRETYEEMKRQIETCIRKYHLKFTLEKTFENEYLTGKYVDYDWFAELCNVCGAEIALVLSPVCDNGITIDDFTRNLKKTLREKGIFMVMVSFAGLKKEYNYLNLALDLATARFELNNYTEIKEEFAEEEKANAYKLLNE